MPVSCFFLHPCLLVIWLRTYPFLSLAFPFFWCSRAAFPERGDFPCGNIDSPPPSPHFSRSHMNRPAPLSLANPCPRDNLLFTGSRFGPRTAPYYKVPPLFLPSRWAFFHFGTAVGARSPTACSPQGPERGSPKNPPTANTSPKTPQNHQKKILVSPTAPFLMRFKNAPFFPLRATRPAPPSRPGGPDSKRRFLF